MPALSSLRIVFMGTPDFAVASLAALLEGGCNIAAVITAPDKPAGRGMQLQESAIKKYAGEKGLKILQPEKLKNPGFLEELKSLQADLQVVVAFRMLPEIVWSMPRLGTINLHGSLLPQYRGAAPINWAIINGEKETGVTTFKLKQEIDTGDILLQESFPVGEDETAGEVHDRMKQVGAGLLLKTIKGLADGTLKETPQSSIINSQSSAADPGLTTPGSPEESFRTHLLNHAPKINTETCRINWSSPVENVHNLVRGLSPYPAAFCTLNEKMLKIYHSKKEILLPAIGEGEYETDGKSFLKFACTNGYLHLLEVQLEGKKKMKIADFLKGYRFEPGH